LDRCCRQKTREATEDENPTFPADGDIVFNSGYGYAGTEAVGSACPGKIISARELIFD
jgi:hypothetical protein